MVSKASDSSSKSKTNESFGNLSHKLNQLKKQIHAERVVLIKEKVEKNREELKIHVSRLTYVTSSRKLDNRSDRLFSSRIEIPLCTFSGFAQGSGDKDYVNGHEVVSSTSSIKLPYVEKIPPYTTWIFLDRNQRMAEDQSVVGRRRIYYDQHGSEALICSDSEEDIVEHEEEKREFSEVQDRIIWMICQEHGLDMEVLNIVSQSIGVTATEVQERYNTLKEKHHEKDDQSLKNSMDSGSKCGISLEKSLSAALDSFDNLFCRRCLLFDCRLHGCSQSLINSIEKQPYWSENQDDQKPCGDLCYLQLGIVKGVPKGSIVRESTDIKGTPLEDKDKIAVSSATKEPNANYGEDILQDDGCTSGKGISVTSEAVHRSKVTAEALKPNTSSIAIHSHDNLGKRKALEHITAVPDNSVLVSADMQDSSSKKQKKTALDVVIASNEAMPSSDHVSSVKSRHVGAASESELQITIKISRDKSVDSTLIKFGCPSSVSCDKAEGSIKGGANNVIEVPELKQSSSTGEIKGISKSSEWKPIEKELYLKGVEIFGRNSCLIARNLLSGLKTCIEISSYMCDSGASMPQRSTAPNLFVEENGKADSDYREQEISSRPRVFRRRGKTRKLKYSWKSAGHPSIWKRIADGKSQSCKQYTPCGCQSMCGRQCPCQHNGTCCEKYCGCSKSCKNRFRGCHCAKSQCRSRQCPCFAAGRECDPDVCRNCWVSCGGGSLGEPPKQGDSQCGNMRLLLRQQQRILLAKSDVAGWGAYLKNSVNKNDYLGEYTGELISHREADKRGKIYDRANSSFLFDLNDQYVLDAYRKGDNLKFANHSSNPNCYAKVMLVAGDHRVGIFAKEHIEAREELFYDYRYGPDQAPIWARTPEGSKREDSSISQGRAKKHQSH
ncbi:SET domain-containing protein [Cephalotus follicularis]|uniref:[histone H3]-lysine(27) N-trimethyltransferase n=1 Tax=Cephalotus follicularis TaxID=3775 RepID=A0A1Q3CTS0_CEPFO|nr:SET domain-containing protein [Cephalotus follicularis]